MNDMEISNFNVKVYALITDTKCNVLITEETYKAQRLIKFPGGGVKTGEGLKDALFRELDEELGIMPISYDLFYVNPDLIQSAFNQKEQLIAFYFSVSFDENSIDKPLKPKDSNVLALKWIKKSELNENDFTFPLDKRVSQLLKVQV